jgi:hypothetical protein
MNRNVMRNARRAPAIVHPIAIPATSPELAPPDFSDPWVKLPWEPVELLDGLLNVPLYVPEETKLLVDVEIEEVVGAWFPSLDISVPCEVKDEVEVKSEVGDVGEVGEVKLDVVSVLEPWETVLATGAVVNTPIVVVLVKSSLDIVDVIGISNVVEDCSVGVSPIVKYSWRLWGKDNLIDLGSEGKGFTRYVQAAKKRTLSASDI